MKRLVERTKTALVASVFILFGIQAMATNDSKINLMMETLSMDSVVERCSRDILRGRLADIEEWVIQNVSEPEKTYWLARITFQRAEYAEQDDNLEEAELLFDESQALIKRYLEDNDSSDAQRLLGDTYMRLMNYKGLVYQIANGLTTQSYPKKAVELDSSNMKAHTSIALLKIYSPVFAGGNIDKGIEILEKVIHEGNSPESYMGYYFKGVALSMQDKLDGALQTVEEGLAVFPSEKGALAGLKEELLAKKNEVN